jgi:uncharacterized ubiquitin-like protein YukD
MTTGRDVPALDVIITDATGTKEQDASVPTDAPAVRIIARLVQLMELPMSGPDGQPLAYKFHHRSSGRQLREDETLAAAGVADGDVLRLVPEITAGAA